MFLLDTHTFLWYIFDDPRLPQNVKDIWRERMYAVIDKTTDRIIRECSSKEAAIIAAQLEKEKLDIPKRGNITAVVLDDGGFTDILF